MKIKVDRKICAGVGNCVAFAPSVFKLDGERKAVTLDPGSVDEQTLFEAAESCPENAILIEDDRDNQIYP